MAHKTHAAITGVHGWVPETKLTNFDLEKMVDTNDEWIVSRTGIRERRILKTPGWATSDMCAEAVRGLLEKTGTKPGEIDLLIVATVTGDMVFPDTANTVCDKIGAKNAFGFDINAACSGFLYALSTASQFVQNETYNKVVVVGADMMSSIVDYKDRNTCIIFGDGAAAVMLETLPRRLGYYRLRTACRRLGPRTAEYESRRLPASGNHGNRCQPRTLRLAGRQTRVQICRQRHDEHGLGSFAAQQK